MIGRYKRTARTIAELELGDLAPMDLAIPELAEVQLARDRTGHKSSVMINRYRRAARTAAELDLGTLAPLVLCIPELSPINGIAEALGIVSDPRTRGNQFPLIAPQMARPAGFEPAAQWRLATRSEQQVRATPDMRPRARAEGPRAGNRSTERMPTGPLEACLPGQAPRRNETLSTPGRIRAGNPKAPRD